MPDEPMPRARTDEPPVLDAHTLRLLAEAADGRRGENYAIFHDGSGYAVSPESRRDGTKLVSVRTAVRAPTRRKAERLVHIQPPGRETTPLPDDVDAIFWSESAVEKFVLPYYQRLLSRREMNDLIDAHESADVIAILHIKPSIYRTVRAKEELGVALQTDEKGELEVLPLTEWARRRRLASEPDGR